MANLMDICNSSKALDQAVHDFMHHVPDAKEESITDYLLWQWRTMDSRLEYISISSFTRIEESGRTGADFDLELWLVGHTAHIALAVQAKKFIKSHDCYVRKLRYPRNTKQQLNMLLSYGSSQRRHPVYFIYTISDPATTTLCPSNCMNSAIFMADAKTMGEFADGKRGKRVSKNMLLAESIPFHCLFCCPGQSQMECVQDFFANYAYNNRERPNDELPEYVQLLLSEPRSFSWELIKELRSCEHLRRFHALAVYDMRNGDE